MTEPSSHSKQWNANLGLVEWTCLDGAHDQYVSLSLTTFNNNFQIYLELSLKIDSKFSCEKFILFCKSENRLIYSNRSKYF